MNGLMDRWGASIRRSPYLWLALTVLSEFVFISPLKVIASSPQHQRTWVGWVAFAWIAYDAAYVVWLFPRLVASRMRTLGLHDRVAAVSWVLGWFPVLVGITAVVAGGPQWPLAVGFVVGLVLLSRLARAYAAEA